MKVLYVDDIRFPEFWHKQSLKAKENEEFEINVVRDFSEAIQLLKNETYDVVDLDHDLGQDKTGYDVCKFIVENQINIPTIVLHTSNPVGKLNMKQLLERYTDSKIIIM